VGCRKRWANREKEVGPRKGTWWAARIACWLLLILLPFFCEFLLSSLDELSQEVTGRRGNDFREGWFTKILLKYLTLN
jgi:hypothetical protein